MFLFQVLSNLVYFIGYTQVHIGHSPDYIIAICNPWYDNWPEFFRFSNSFWNVSTQFRKTWKCSSDRWETKTQHFVWKICEISFDSNIPGVNFTQFTQYWILFNYLLEAEFIACIWLYWTLIIFAVGDFAVCIISKISFFLQQQHKCSINISILPQFKCALIALTREHLQRISHQHVDETFLQFFVFTNLCTHAITNKIDH